ncbi:WecB/TagA/CpsF family glycosyltransferase [Ferrimonas sp. SCSIO 43195]|uniref:WecB/TagA/CpsF family glycosyltransferase n=1 Tax=Ferrimonas sp. SCSIO 43195 TaxID=2822844 RepID=UPI0020758B82|nr:WecB/TagA/CpsF family glycosyltransferase [Ferrimonas sp. SCSIO 43195]USD38674.1 WecB/TagA/CpsF family glycosyltransferase [Ferrimonas sp. SCSIO 43195]
MEITNKLVGEHSVSAKDIVCWMLDGRKVISFINPVNYISLRKNNETMSKVDYYFCDGMLASSWFSFLTGKKLNRFSFDFTSLAGPFFEQCAASGKKIYIVGARTEEIENFTNLIESIYPKVNIVGYRDGYIQSESYSSVCSDISRLSPDVVLVGMGCPRQEQFALVASKCISSATTFVTCGGFIHQTQHSQNYYPDIINRLHLRMPYRFIKEKHTRNRLPAYPKFIFSTIYDFKVK